MRLRTLDSGLGIARGTLARGVWAVLLAGFVSACGTPSKTCGPETCSEGCCDDQLNCIRGSHLNSSRCGGGGTACYQCNANQTCSAGACVDGSGGGAGGGAGGGTGGGVGGGAGGGAGGGSGSGSDAGVDGGSDAGSDAGFDGGSDAGVDGGFDAGGPVDAGPPVLKLFVTRTHYDADLEKIGTGVGPLAAADSLCQFAAEASFLGGTWRAWLSTTTGLGTNAISRMADAGPWYQQQADAGRILTFDDLQMLAAVPRAGLSVDELGANITVEYWTGTQVGGTASNSDCSDFSSNFLLDSATTGSTGRADGGWTSVTTRACDNVQSLLCIEQDLAPAPGALGAATKRLFVTSGVHSGRFADAGATPAMVFANADAFCAQHAAAAGKTGTFVAWLSVPGGAAIDRLPPDAGPWYQAFSDGGLLLTFTNRSNLATVPRATIQVDETGATLASLPYWTGTAAGGRPRQTCSGFTTSSSGTGTSGRTGSTGLSRGWTQDGAFGCGSTMRVLCLEL